jgi:two-component system, OmpR family, sensor histidine kinase TctE
MALELAEIAAGLPMAASFALASGITSLREGRRRSVLNEAMHELRRPLQTLSLALPADDEAADSSLRLAAAALERLDREVNGSPTAVRRETVVIGCLLRAAAARWKTRAVHGGRGLQLRGGSEEMFVQGDPIALAQALDNLINNALEHGGGQVVVEARKYHGWVRLSVLDSGRPGTLGKASRRGRRSKRGRRGHGLRVVAQVAREHRGTFSLKCSHGGSEARLWLPLVSEGQR